MKAKEGYKKWLRVRLTFTVRSPDWNEENREDIQSELEAMGGDVEMETVATRYAKEWTHFPSYFISYVVPGKSRDYAKSLREDVEKYLVENIARY